MIRGAIENVEATPVSGWIHAGPHKVRDHLIHAFAGPRIAGSGRVEISRPDLADSGPGHGYRGFHFPIALRPGQHQAAIVIRLADPDAALIQATSKVGP